MRPPEPSAAVTPTPLPTLRPATGRSPIDFERALAEAVSGELLFDAISRHIYATDAGAYAIEPLGVLFPRDVEDVVQAVRIAGDFGVPIIPRGAATSLNGQTVGAGLVLDFSRHMDRILEVDAKGRRARVEPGVVQDALNRAAAPHGLFFAPDTSTSSRATLGGMIGNNSCGARSARYGMTVDHVESLTVVLADGSVATLRERSPEEVMQLAEGDSLEARLYRELPPLIEERAEAIREALPPHWRRSGGYRLERLLPERGGFDLAQLVTGSEGSLAIVVEATVRLEPKPRAISALVGHFHTVREAVAASHPAMECGAMAVELMDHLILDLARSSPIHRHLAEKLEGHPGAILWVEFYGDSLDETVAGMERLRERWEQEGHGYAIVPAPTAAEQKGFQELRKAGLGLLMAAGKGRERTVAFVEDTAVDPARLAEYADRLTAILEGEGLRAGFYGHASAGCIHLRPFMDLSLQGAPEKVRRVSEAVFELVREFGGMNSSEHGDGLARGEFNRRFFGEVFYATMVEVKALFDPEGLLNPGKKVASPPLTEHLRDQELPLLGAPRLETYFPFDPELGMLGTANRCMRIGECRKSAETGGVMCPSFMATREEEHSTRGRANALVRALSLPDPKAALTDERLYEVLDLCLECKACQTECPLSVDMATMKSEFLAHYQERHGVSLRTRLFGHVRTLNRLGSALAPLSNLPLGLRPFRALLDRFVGIDRRRPLPRFERVSLSHWFHHRPSGGDRSHSGSVVPPYNQNSGSRGVVVFLGDSFTSYTESSIGRAAIELLEMAGWEVQLEDRVCCGRSLISKGLLREAKVQHAALLDRLAPLARAGVPIVGCEPSCLLTLEDELPALAHHSEPARAVAGAARLVEDLLVEALEGGALELDPDSSVANRTILFHGHCHQKAAGATESSIRILRAIPGAKVQVLDAGCCGMAGSFGFEKEHYDLSMQIGEMRLFPAVRGAPEGALIAAAGVSCRQQVQQGTGRSAEHPVVLLRRAVKVPASAGRGEVRARSRE